MDREELAKLVKVLEDSGMAESSKNLLINCLWSVHDFLHNEDLDDVELEDGEVERILDNLPREYSLQEEKEDG